MSVHVFCIDTQPLLELCSIPPSPSCSFSFSHSLFEPHLLASSFRIGHTSSDHHAYISPLHKVPCFLSLTRQCSWSFLRSQLSHHMLESLALSFWWAQVISVLWSSATTSTTCFSFIALTSVTMLYLIGNLIRFSFFHYTVNLMCKNLMFIHFCGFSKVAPVVKNPPANAEDLNLIPGSGKSPGEGNGTPLQYSCLGCSMEWGA